MAFTPPTKEQLEEHDRLDAAFEAAKDSGNQKRIDKAFQEPVDFKHKHGFVEEPWSPDDPLLHDDD